MPPVQVSTSSSAATTVAKVLTLVFQPNVLQASLLLMMAGTQPLGVQVVVVLLSFVVPLAGYVAYLRGNRLPFGFDLPRQYRVVPFLINNASLVALSLWVQYVALPDADDRTGLILLLLGVAYLLVINLIAGLITLAYKISLHLTAAAGMSVLWYVPTGIPLGLNLIVMAGLLLGLSWARLRLEAHDGTQLVTGMAIGIATPMVLLSVTGIQLP